MTKFFHIVQVHPVENGEPNLYKVVLEREFETQEEANNFVVWYNKQLHSAAFNAVYVGCVNDETGELV